MSRNRIYIKNDFSSLPIIHQNPYSLNSKPYKIISEKSTQNLHFNIMPGKYVDENIEIKEYRVWDNAIETIFNRDYHTEMLDSPSHLTFLSSLINLQKMVYVFMHDYLSLKYDKNGQELLKVWPGNLEIRMPKMILNKENISHLMVVKSIAKISKNKYKVCASTSINDIVTISGDALIVVL